MYDLAKMYKAGINIPLQRESTEDQEARNRKGLVFIVMCFLQYAIAIQAVWKVKIDPTYSWAW